MSTLQNQLCKNPIQDATEYTLYIDGSPNVSFTGELLAELDNATLNWRQTGCDELHIYRTTNDTIICFNKNYHGFDSQYTTGTYAICTTVEEVTDFFGFTDTAKRLYNDVGLNADITID